MTQTPEDAAVVPPLGVVEEPKTARQALNEMVDAGLFDSVFQSIDEGLAYIGKAGFENMRERGVRVGRPPPRPPTAAPANRRESSRAQTRQKPRGARV